MTAPDSPASSASPENGGRDPRLEVAFGVRVAAWWSVCFVAIIVALWLLVRLLNSISLVTITVTVAVMITALLEPAVRFLHRLGVPRALAGILVFVLGIVGLSFLVWFVVTQVTDSSELIQNELQDAAETIRDWLINGPLELKVQDAEKYTTNLGDTLSEHRDTIVNGFLQTANSAIAIISGSVFCLFATLFLMLDDGAIFRWFVRIFPPHTREHVAEGGVAAWKTLTVYMRSLVLLAALNALAMVPVMMIAGMPLVVPLAVLLFLGSLVPLIGVLVAGAVVCLIALVANGITSAIVVGIALVLVVQLFGNLLNPIILGKFVNIHPLAILVTVTAGTLVAGIFGAFVAVPLVAVINNVAHAVRQHHRSLPGNVAEPAGDANGSAGDAAGDADGATRQEA
ncbi:AI-2E family transporter [Luteipulveratus mongoliensis]|nr:AI-2E family transporter [Luteipulveratus mongoliensis]